MDNVNCIQLVKLVQKYPCLYETATKDEAWQEISKTMNLPVNKCKEKWLNLRRAYCRALKMNTWHYISDHIHFVKPFLMINKNTEVNEAGPSNKNYVNDVADSDDDIIEAEANPNEEQIIPRQPQAKEAVHHSAEPVWNESESMPNLNQNASNIVDLDDLTESVPAKRPKLKRQMSSISHPTPASGSSRLPTTSSEGTTSLQIYTSQLFNIAMKLNLNEIKEFGDKLNNPETCFQAIADHHELINTVQKLLHSSGSQQ